ncbi:hypothetical protein C0993_008133 [Termitomyces sp. T159_Od127]|nr:hypothetical protein C0993_008133 [Termitomyces sp. T159_Od127]
MSILPERMRSGGTWVRPDKRRPNYFLPCSLEGNGEIYHFDEEPLILPKDLGYGYYPVALGDVIPFGRASLRVVRKLGWANGSTVWLCLNDQVDSKLQQKYVALKIETAFNHHLPSTEAQCFEGMKRQITRGAQFCLPLLAQQTLSSLHGDHRSFVTPITGPDLIELAESRGSMYSLPVVRKIIRQVLLGLEHMHACGFLHCDVKCDNVVVRLPDESLDITIDELLKNSPPETYPPVAVPALYSEPYITLKSQPISPLWLEPDLRNLEVQLIDYGEGMSCVLDIQVLSDPLL